MKFILSEEKAKLFLLERYILTEADDDPLSDLEDREAAANQQAAAEKTEQEDPSNKNDAIQLSKNEKIIIKIMMLLKRPLTKLLKIMTEAQSSNQLKTLQMKLDV